MSVSVVSSHARAHAHIDDALWQILFSGFFINSNGIPVFFDWIKYLSPMKYSYGAFMQNEYEVTLIIKAYSTRVICCEDVRCVRLRARVLVHMHVCMWCVRASMRVRFIHAERALGSGAHVRGEGESGAFDLPARKRSGRSSHHRPSHKSSEAQRLFLSCH